jgi:hypothetical protein
MNVGGFVKTILPWIGAAASGNVPALVSLASDAVSKAVGKPVASTSDAIAEAVAGATPDQILALKQADNDFAEKMRAMGFQYAEDVEKIAAEDRANARQRETTLRDRLPAILSISITLGFFGLLALMIFHVMPTSSEKIIDIMVGSLGTAWIQVVSYYFGSSAAHDAMTAKS